MGSNKILPVLALVMGVMVIFVVVKALQSDPDNPALMSSVPVAGTPDADSPADTIRTLTAQVAAIKSTSASLQKQNEALLRQRDEIESRVKTQLRSELVNSSQNQETGAVSQLTQQLDHFKTRLDELSLTQNQQASAGAVSDIPVGFGLDDQDHLLSASPLIWIEPLGTQIDKLGQPLYQSITADAESLLHSGQDKARTTAQYLAESADALTEPMQPVYTVPRNATLIGSTGMTALIGRIPFDGAIEDPFPFKVIVGRDNLAANGIDMPGLDGMIFSGKASGDWTLSCVRGQVHSVTYVFADGTLRTLSSDDGSLAAANTTQGAQPQHGNQLKALGWISDRRGIPCVTGTRISNAATYLGGRILASAAEAAAGAFSQSQVSNTVSAAQGVSTSVITGDAAHYAGGQALAGGASEVSDYLRERAAQSFDVIYVDTGSELAIHVDVALPIDYDPQGRKTQYELTDYEADYELD